MGQGGNRPVVEVIVTRTRSLSGAHWLLGDSDPGDIFTPEQLSSEHRMIAKTAEDFLAHEVLPSTEALEKKDWARARTLMARAGELGLLGIDVPEEFGGVGLDKAASIVASEALGPATSFSATFGAQTNLTIAPLLWFGTADQQQRYLSRLVSGEIVGAYALSESGSGSDALGARARADRQPDGSWRLNGEKLWITNGGFADLFVVFAKVDGDKFSAFLVERGFPGVSSGREEHKMGLHGSSTTPLILQDANLPSGNLLGEVGQGHKIAFNVLNYGRFKLAAMCSGNAKAAIRESAHYALSRRQFDRPIAEFGAIRQKLADMTIQAYAVESALFRTAGLIDRFRNAAGDPVPAAAALDEFAVEASLLKVAGSEMLDFVLDENVQIHGGNGFVQDYPAERRYRDARVNRIFEGTNEINRLLVPAMLMKRLPKGVRPPATGLKGAAALVLETAALTYGHSFSDQQEVLLCVSDIVRDAFVADSAGLRAAAGPPPHADVAAVFSHEATIRAKDRARTALAGMLSGDTLMGALDRLDRTVTPWAMDTIAAKRRIADAVLAKRAYAF